MTSYMIMFRNTANPADAYKPTDGTFITDKKHAFKTCNILNEVHKEHNTGLEYKVFAITEATE